MRVVIDTNVFVSSFFGGNPRKVIDYWFSGRLTLCLSKPILEEYFDVLSRFDFDDDTLLMKLMSSIERNANILFVENPEEDQWIIDDPKDDKFIACAIALKTNYIVSGDSHLTKAKQIGNVKILTPSEILALLSRKG
jgi:putative PIN family toxin of toxin-antitoxin system